jgi:hypothetical protein
VFPVTRVSAAGANRITAIAATAQTHMAWLRLVNIRASAATLCIARANTAGTTNISLGTDTDGVSLLFWNGAANTALNRKRYAGRWAHSCFTLANVTSGAAWTVYIDGEQVGGGTLGAALSPTTPAVYVGTDSDGNWADSHWCSWKYYSKVLSAGEIRREMLAATPLERDGLIGFLDGAKPATTADLWTKNAWAAVTGWRSEGAPSAPPFYTPRSRNRIIVPSAGGGGDVTVNADLLTFTGALQAPAVTGDSGLTSDVLSATGTFQALTLSAGAGVTSDLLTAIAGTKLRIRVGSAHWLTLAVGP